MCVRESCPLRRSRLSSSGKVWRVGCGREWKRLDSEPVGPPESVKQCSFSCFGDLSGTTGTREPFWSMVGGERSQRGHCQSDSEVTDSGTGGPVDGCVPTFMFWWCRTLRLWVGPQGSQRRGGGSLRSWEERTNGSTEWETAGDGVRHSTRGVFKWSRGIGSVSSLELDYLLPLYPGRLGTSRRVVRSLERLLLRGSFTPHKWRHKQVKRNDTSLRTLTHCISVL